MNQLKIDISPTAYLGAAAAVLLLPLDLLLGALMAAAIHELFHFLVLRSFGVRVTELKIGMMGARMTTGAMLPHQELISAAAGPFGSLILLIFLRTFPVLAFFGFFQGLFNLIPVYPLDGGRMLKSILKILSERKVTSKNPLQRSAVESTIDLIKNKEGKL